MSDTEHERIDGVYELHDTLVFAESFGDGGDEWDVSEVPPYTLETIPEDKSAVRVIPVERIEDRGWWMWREEFEARATLISATNAGETVDPTSAGESAAMRELRKGREEVKEELERMRSGGDE